MQITDTQQHLYMWIVGGALSAFITYIQLLIRADNQKNKIDILEKLEANKGAIRNDIAQVAQKAEEVKEELSAKQDDLKDDLNSKHLENTTVMKGHIQEDRAINEANSRTFKRIDDTLTRLEERTRKL